MTGGEQVIVFQVGPEVYAARAGGVRRIGSPRDRFDALLGESILGRPFAISRGLVAARADDGELALGVDQVIGVRAVASSDVHPLPSLARSCLRSAVVAGLVLIEGVPTFLIDLPNLIREQLSAAAHDARSSDA